MIVFLPGGKNMPGIIDRLLLLVCCSILHGNSQNDMATVAVTLAAITICALNGFFHSRPLLATSTVFYTLAGLFWPPFCPYLPLVYYDTLAEMRPPGPGRWFITTAAGALLICFLSNPVNKSLMIAALMAVSFLLADRTRAVEQAKEEARQLRDDSHEMSLLYKEKNRELIAKQDYEIRLATLNERGRIAREIHDHVGHLLSRSILQVGAFMAINRSKEVRQNLATIRGTLSEAMNRIRSSVHDLHDETLDFQTRVETLVNGFTFCSLHLQYRLENEPEQDISYCFLAVIKEGLNNIVRHSNATRVTLSLLEHPTLYQLVLQDNGAPPAGGEPGKGLGLRSMAHRVSALEGQLVIEQAGGYRLFISIPKRRAGHESASC